MNKSRTFEDFYGGNYRSPLDLNFERGFNFRLLCPKFSRSRYDELEAQWWHLGMALPYGSTLPEIIEELHSRPITIDEAQELNLLEVLWVWPNGRGERVRAVRFLNILILRPPDPFQRDNPAKSTPLVYWLNPENPNHHQLLDYLETHAPEGTSDNIQTYEPLPSVLLDGLDDDDLLTQDEIISRGIDRFAWESYGFQISPPVPEKTQPKINDRERAFLREMALDSLVRTYLTARARTVFIREQIEMLDQEQQLLETLSTPKEREKTTNDHNQTIGNTRPQPEAIKANIPIVKPNKIPPSHHKASR